MKKVLAKHRAVKKVWTIVEDNDPAGFKSSKARAAKKEVGMKELSLPPYSPDLNPLDFAFWRAVETRARESVGKRALTVKEYKATLRRTALRLSAKIVGKAVDGDAGAHWTGLPRGGRQHQARLSARFCVRVRRNSQ